jgi:predicted dehydrogenase
MVADGRVGDVRAVDVWFSYFNDDPTNIRNILDVGGGALWDIGCYAVNAARMVYGDEPVRVEASIRRDPMGGTDVVSSGLLEFAGGVATFTVSTRLEPDQRVHIYGDRGRISVGIPFNIPPDLPAEVFVTQGGDPPVAPNTEVLSFGPANQYTIQAEAFASAVLDGTPVPIAPNDAVANTRVIEQLFAAG